MAVSLDLKNLSPRVMALLVLVAFGVVGYFYYFFFLQNAIKERADLQTRLAGLQQEVGEKERIAQQKTRFLKEVADLKEAFQSALTKLPDKREIQPLFQQVASLGKATGMDFLLFQPKPPEPPAADKAPSVKDNLKPSDQRVEQKPAAGQAPSPKAPPAKTPEPEKFYEDVPITVSLNGQFHNTLAFFAKVATLPRIINIENITMGEGKDVKGNGRIIKTDCVIKTYMFVDKQR
jgi:type IV pilus assembly protein PilO